MKNRPLFVVILCCAMLCNAVALAAASGEYTPPAARISLGYTPWTGFGPLFIAQEKGLFKKHGVDVELIEMQNPYTRKQALAADRIQGMASAFDVAVAIAGQGLPLKIVWLFDESAGADGLVARPGLKKIADLQEKTVALQHNSTSHLFLNALLAKAGMSENSLVLVNMGGREAAAALLAGKVDAAVTWEPYLGQAATAGATILATSEQTPGLITDALSFSAAFVRDNREAVQNFLAAIAEASAFMKSTPDEAAQILAPLLGITPEAVALDLAGLLVYDCHANRHRLGKRFSPGPVHQAGLFTAKFFYEQRINDTVPDMARLIDASFLDDLR